VHGLSKRPGHNFPTFGKVPRRLHFGVCVRNLHSRTGFCHFVREQVERHAQSRRQNLAIKVSRLLDPQAWLTLSAAGRSAHASDLGFFRGNDTHDATKRYIVLCTLTLQVLLPSLADSLRTRSADRPNQDGQANGFALALFVADFERGPKRPARCRKHAQESRMVHQCDAARFERRLRPSTRTGDAIAESTWGALTTGHVRQLQDDGQSAIHAQRNAPHGGPATPASTQATWLKFPISGWASKR
jgi:hypothetical protein